MSSLRVMIVEDEPIIAEDIADMLQRMEFEACGVAYTKEAAIDSLKNIHPDFLLIDINLGNGGEGIEIADHVNQFYRLPFIFLTSYSDKVTLQQAKAVHPFGYVVKPFTEQSLYAAIEIALHLHAMQYKQLYPGLNQKKINKQLSLPLTQREFEVLQMIYDGNTNNQIANTLFLSGNTIKKHINNAYLKMDVRTRTQSLSLLRKLMSNPD